jgi:hypothetical protein
MLMAIPWKPVVGRYDGDLGVLKVQGDWKRVYCPERGECCYLHAKVDSSNAALRVEAPKNDQQKTRRFAADRRRVP